MLNNLISAYRFKFYDLTYKKIIELIVRNKKLFLLSCVIIIGIFVSFIYYIYFHSPILMLIIILLEIAIGIWADRYVVKEYQKYILNKKQHLNEVIFFLQTTIPECNLYNEAQIDILLDRLAKYIEDQKPYKSIIATLKGWGNVVVLPIITYIAGLYANQISQLEYIIVISLALSLMIMIGLGYIAFSILAQLLQTITCRNYDAAVAFREDLLDLKLVHFSNKKKNFDNNSVS